MDARALARRAAFALLRAVQKVTLYEGSTVISGRPLRLLHVGNPRRGRHFVARLVGKEPAGRRLGHALVRPVPGRPHRGQEGCDALLVEINRLYAPAYRRAGFFTIPEWVEFGCRVVGDPAIRYAGARKSLKCDLRALRAAGLQVVLSRRPEDFRFFVDRMVRPHASARFAGAAISKDEARMRRDFKAGFLLLLERGGSRVAGALVRVDGERVSETTFGALDGSEDVLKAGASAALDHTLHDWAAEHGMREINVGHTRPFPDDGVFFNKRKWLMSVLPDDDGVMDHALLWQGPEELALEALAASPFIYEAGSGLGALVVRHAPRPLDADGAVKAVRLHWTEGLRSMILVCPQGFEAGSRDRVRELHGGGVHLCTGLEEALGCYMEGV